MALNGSSIIYMGQDKIDWENVAGGQQYKLKETHTSQKCLKDTRENQLIENSIQSIHYSHNVKQ